MINTPFLGAFSRASGLVSMESLERAIGENFSQSAAEVNIQGAQLTYQETKLNRAWRP